MGVPIEVMLKGPEAVADWLVKQMGESPKSQQQRLIDMHLAMVSAALPDLAKAKDRDVRMAMGAAMFTAAVIMYAGKSGMRGPARDALSELMDLTFDTIDELSQVPELAGVFTEFRK